MKNLLLIISLSTLIISPAQAADGKTCGEVVVLSGSTCSDLKVKFLLGECGEFGVEKDAQIKCKKNTATVTAQTDQFRYIAKIHRVTNASGNTIWDIKDRLQQKSLKKDEPELKSAKLEVKPKAARALASTQNYAESLTNEISTSKKTQDQTQARSNAEIDQSFGQVPGRGYVLIDHKAFSMKINAFGQTRYTLNLPESAKHTQNFDVALFRLAFSGTATNLNLDYFFQFQTTTFGNNNGVSLLDGWLQYRASPYFNVIAGRYIIPYTRQFYTHPGELLFADLSAADYAFHLTRSLGAGFSGKVDRLSYHFSVMNSVRALDGAGQNNTTNALASIGRLEFDVLEPYGYLESDPKLSDDQPRLSLGVAGAINPIEEESAFQNLRKGDSTKNLTVDFGFRWLIASLQGGYYVRRRANGNNIPELTDTGFYTQGGLFVLPKTLELAGRFSRVRFDRQVALGTLGNVDETTVGLNYYIKGHSFKVQADHTWIKRNQFDQSNRLDHQVRIQTQVLF